MQQVQTKTIIGWDIGGAHIKAAAANGQGEIIRVVQRPCALWQGLHELQKAVDTIVLDLDLAGSHHALTMTGELVDLFANRLQGVKQIVQVMSELLGEQNVVVFSGKFGFLQPVQITDQHLEQIASTNWLASVGYVAQHYDAGLFVDIGSTTTDIILFSKGQAEAQGLTDYQRLASQELVYTGIIRTPVMAICRKVDFQGEQVGVMAEYFATMADVYRITGELDERHDQMPAADNGDKTIADSIRRLARMIGCDAEDFSAEAWLKLAEQLKTKQLLQLQQACSRQLERGISIDNPILVGAGVGKFLVKQLAAILGLAYQDLSEIMQHDLPKTDMDIADCLPAVAVARLSKTQFK